MEMSRSTDGRRDLECSRTNNKRHHCGQARRSPDGTVIGPNRQCE